MAAEAEYVLGTNDAELVRLGLQHKLWSAQAFALWERAGFRSGSTVLDLGCGPGDATIDLSRLVGAKGRIIALDESQKFIAELRRRLARLEITNVDAYVADVQAFDLPEASIDAAYERWVLCFVARPIDAIRRVARALRPGGVFALQDYFNYEALTLAPRGPALARVVQGVARAWRDRGGDPDFVGRLPAMLAECGLELREIRPHLRVATPGELLWQWPTTFFHNFVPALVAGGYLSHAEQDAFEAEWRERSADAHSRFHTPPVYDVIAVKR